MPVVEKYSKKSSSMNTYHKVKKKKKLKCGFFDRVIFFF